MIEQHRTEEQQDMVNKLYTVMILTIYNSTVNHERIADRAIYDFIEAVRLIDLLNDPQLIWC